MRCEVMWEWEESLFQEVQTAWDRGDNVHGLGDMAGRLKKVMVSLKRWSVEKFGAVTKEIAVLKAKIGDLSVKIILQIRKR
jgi:hypothetical protein